MLARTVTSHLILPSLSGRHGLRSAHDLLSQAAKPPSPSVVADDGFENRRLPWHAEIPVKWPRPKLKA